MRERQGLAIQRSERECGFPQAVPPVCRVTVKKLPNLSGPFLYLEKGLIREILLTLGAVNQAASHSARAGLGPG